MLCAVVVCRLQLETVIYAAFRHSITLKDGSRSGLLLGDGPGIGKGRQIAGIIFNNFRQDRKKAIWFSVSADLKEDVGLDCKIAFMMRS